MLYPATISASASGKSNGARFVSARIDIKKTIALGKSGIIYQTDDNCFETISIKLNELAQTATGITIRPIETSYEIN